jgi:hypothetical protein
MTTENQTNVLETLVGEGKKYKTPEDLAKSRIEADAFIEILKSELATVREEVKKLGLTDDRKIQLEKLMSSLTNTTNDGTTKPDQKPTGGADQTPKALSHDDVVRLLEQRDAEAAKARNFAAALAPFRKVHGEKTDEALAKKAAELGMPVESLLDLAKTSPVAFQNAVGVNARDSSTRSMANASSVNALGATDPGAPSIRNKAYYDGLMKQMGALKFALDAPLQVQMHKDLRAMGDEWDPS